MQTPDTAEAVTAALRGLRCQMDAQILAKAAIQAHNKALAEAIPERGADDYPGFDHAFAIVKAIEFNEARRLFLGEDL